MQRRTVKRRRRAPDTSAASSVDLGGRRGFLLSPL
jgi:hypothetical protein